MNHLFFRMGSLAVLVFITACTTPLPTPTPVPATATPLPSLTLPALPPQPTATPLPSATPSPPTVTPRSAPSTATSTIASATKPKPTNTPKPAGRLLMTSNRASYDDLYSMNEDGSNVTRLTTMGKVYDGHYSPDCRLIVFSHESDIYTMNADGSGIKNLTNTQFKVQAFPVWSPDGKRIAYLFGWEGGFEIYIANADGTNPHALTSKSLDIEPAWSPDCSRIAFASGRVGRSEIWMTNVDGTGLKQITFNGLINRSPIWSPDGKQIAFSQYNPIPGEQWKVVVSNADGSGGDRVVINAIGNDPGNSTYIAAWKRNRLLIGGYRGNWDVFYVNLDGSGLTPLTDDPRDDKPSDWCAP